ncbi:MAG: hypothetical protein Q7I99_05235 [Acholeplasmataceae bacterium]|nr:hypothetical protein [Acholeplasmataceae bacterium]
MKKKNMTLGIIIVASIMILMMLVGVIGYYYFDWSWYPTYGHMGFMMPFGFILMVLFWVGVASLFIHFFEFRDNSKKNNAKIILDERLSKGEISIEEYERILKIIKE